MTEPEPRIAQLIDAYTPPSPGLPDWDDVVRRAVRPAARRPLITGTRILLIAAALAVLLAGSAVAGVGPGRLLLGLVRDDEPAPAPVKHALAHVFHWPHGTHVLLDQSRLVSRQTEVTHWTNDGRPVVQVVENWIAPIADGGYCSGQRFVPGDDGSQGYSYSCTHGPLRPALRFIQTSPSGWRRNAGIVHWDPWLLDGTAPARTARMVLVHRDGRRTLVPLLPRLVAGLRYFAVRLAPETATTADGPTVRGLGRQRQAHRRRGAHAAQRASTDQHAGRCRRAAGAIARGAGSIRTTFRGQRGTRVSPLRSTARRAGRGASTSTSQRIGETNAGSSFSLLHRRELRAGARHRHRPGDTRRVRLGPAGRHDRADDPARRHRRSGARRTTARVSR